jgi:hypothetical protein
MAMQISNYPFKRFNLLRKLGNTFAYLDVIRDEVLYKFNNSMNTLPQLFFIFTIYLKSGGYNLRVPRLMNVC